MTTVQVPSQALSASLGEFTSEIAIFAVAGLIYVLCAVFFPKKRAPRKSAVCTVEGVLPSSPTQAKAAGRRPVQAKRVTTANATSSGTELQRQAAKIKACGREQDLKGARAVFDEFRASGATLSPMIYNCFLDACVQCGDVDAAVAHFEEMKKLDFVDLVGYNTVLKAHLAKGCTDKARGLLKEMAARGLQANKVTYNELLHSTVTSKDRNVMWTILAEMQEAGVRVNSVTCSILLKSLTVQSPPWDVKRVIGLIEEVEEPIDEVLFSSVIDACIRLRQLDTLSKLLRRCAEKSGPVKLTAPSYGSMIKAYGQTGDVTQVWQLWREMEKADVTPTSVTIGCMVEALVMNWQAEEALELVHKQLESEERRGYINTVIYSTVLKGFAVNQQIDKAFAVYTEMRDNGIACNTITYNTLLDACAKCWAMERAAALLEDMKKADVEPDIISYSTILKGYCHAGDLDKAFNVIDDMKRKGGFEPDEIMFNSILDGCAKQHRVKEAMQVLDDMKAAKIAPSNYTISILVKLLGHEKRLNQAFTMMEDLSKQNGFRPNVQVYTCLVQACIHNRCLDRALGIYDTMIADASCKIDEKFYSVLVRGCLQLRQPLKAADVVRAAFQLPGHNFATNARRSSRPTGVDTRSIEDVARALRNGGQAEQAALSKLGADLLEQRGINMDTCSGVTARQGGGCETDARCRTAPAAWKRTGPAPSRAW